MKISSENYQEITEFLRFVSNKAAKKIVEIYYNLAYDIKKKADNSPITRADLESNNIICKNLKKEFPKIPIISEENTTRNSKEPIFFLVDPLDGTKEFIKRNDEFTVNIALIINRKSTLGIIDLPSKNIQYFSDGKNSFKFYNGILKKISSSKKREKINIVVSRSHPDESSKNFLNSIKVKSNIIEVGSSIKFCLLAEGKVDLYYRYGNTMEWDTAAGSAIIQTAKANIINFKFKDFDYGKKNFRNSSFIVFNKNINKNLLKLIIKKKKP